MFEMKYPVMEEANADAAAGSPAEPAPSNDAPAVPPTALDDWRSSLPPDVANLPSIQDVPDVATLVKNYDNTKAMVGNSVRIPTSEAGQEAIDAFTAKLLEHENIPLMRKPDPESPEAMEDLYKRLGRPEEPSGYEMPDGADPETFGAMTQVAHQAGLTNAQMKVLAEANLAQHNQALDTFKQQRMDSVMQVKGEWGPAFDEKVGRATQVAEALKAPPKLVDALKKGEVDGETLRFLDTVATQLGQEGSSISQQIGQVSAETMDELEQKIEDRTNRLIREDLPQRERDRLIQMNLRDRENLMRYRG